MTVAPRDVLSNLDGAVQIIALVDPAANGVQISEGMMKEVQQAQLGTLMMVNMTPPDCDCCTVLKTDNGVTVKGVEGDATFYPWESIRVISAQFSWNPKAEDKPVVH